MPQQIVITVGRAVVRAELNDTATARAIVAALPITAPASRWGGEIYLPIPVEADLENGARDVLEAGDLGYWPPGKVFCLFFGPTPASRGDEIRAASAVNIVGRIHGDLACLAGVPDGAVVAIASASEGV